jgi:hypothetical protein
MNAFEQAPTEALARRLGAALESDDPQTLGVLLHPRVRWGGEEETPETCHSRGDVLAWYGRLHAAGVRARVDETVVTPRAVVLGMSLSGPGFGPDGPRPGQVFQVFRTTDGLVADIRGFPTRDEALALAERPLHLDDGA